MEVSGAGTCKASNDQRFFYWIYWVSDATAQAEWLLSLIHKASINKSLLGFFVILIGCLDIGILSWSSSEYVKHVS